MGTDARLGRTVAVTIASRLTVRGDGRRYEIEPEILEHEHYGSYDLAAATWPGL